MTEEEIDSMPAVRLQYFFHANKIGQLFSLITFHIGLINMFIAEYIHGFNEIHR